MREREREREAQMRREKKKKKKKKKGERRTETDGWIEIEYAAIRRSRPKSFYNFNSVKCSL